MHNSSSTAANNASSTPSISDDGRYVVYQSTATNLVSGQADFNANTDIFVYDRVLDVTRLVSGASGSSTNTAASASSSAIISADGSTIVFSSLATNLISGVADANGGADLFAYDVIARSIRLVSRSSNSDTITANSPSDSHSITADGKRIAYRSSASNLVTGQVDTNGTSDVFLFDGITSTTSLVSGIAGSPTNTGNGMSDSPSISGNGSFIAFRSAATNLVAGQVDTNSTADIFVYDVMAGAQRLVSGVNGSLTQTSNNASETPSISYDGNIIVFASRGTNVFGSTFNTQVDNNGTLDVFLFDRTAGAVEIVSRVLGQTRSTGNGLSFRPSVNASGRFVAYETSGTDPFGTFPGGGNSNAKIAVYDRVTKANLLASGAGGTSSLSDGNSTLPQISSDGSTVLYQSLASNLSSITRDRDGAASVYQFAVTDGSPTIISKAVTPSFSAGGVSSIPTGVSNSVSTDGRYLVFTSTATNIISGQTDSNGMSDVFVFDRLTGTMELLSHMPGSVMQTMPGQSYNPTISEDGRFVAFKSDNSVAGTFHGIGNLYLYDRLLKTSRLLNGALGSTTTPASQGGSNAQFSSDGNLVLFTSSATNIVSGLSGAFIFDRINGVTQQIGGSIVIENPRLSADGKFVVFSSASNAIVPGQVDNNASQSVNTDLFLYEISSNSIQLVSGIDGSQTQTGNRSSMNASISGDGRYVAYTSTSTNLVSGQISSTIADRVFLYDRIAGTTKLISHTSTSPVDGGTGGSDSPVVNRDGTYIVYRSFLQNIVPGQVSSYGVGNIFSYNILNGTNELITGIDGSTTNAGNGSSSTVDFNPSAPSVSLDGQRIAFVSAATNLVNGQIDENGSQIDVFVYDRTNRKTESASLGGNGRSISPIISGDGRTVYFSSLSTNFTSQDYNLSSDIFVYVDTSKPTDISITNTSIAENEQVGSLVGTFSDPADDEGMVYSLVDGTGDVDNSYFSINAFGRLATEAIFDFEIKSTYSIRVRATNQGGLWFEKVFVITVSDVSEGPTDIVLSSNTILENSIANSLVGTLTATGANPSETTFEIVSETIPDPNFVLDGNQLRTTRSFDYESNNVFTVSVRAISAWSSITRPFLVHVTPVNEFDPQLTSQLTYSIPENSIFVTNLTGGDADLPNPNLMYSIVGGPDAARFAIATGSTLSFFTAPNFEAPIDADGNNVYVVQIAISDGTRSQTHELSITVTDRNDAPTGLTLSNSTISENLPAGSVIGVFNANDEDGPLPLSYQLLLVGPNDNNSFTIVGNQLVSAREFDFENLADRELVVQVAASDGLLMASHPSQFIISVSDSPDRPIAENLTLSTLRNQPTLIMLAASGAGPLSYTIVDAPNHGTLSGTVPNLTYTPHNGFVGNDEFYFSVNDGALTSYEARVAIAVIGTKPTIQFAANTSSVSEAVGAIDLTIAISEPADVDLWIPISVNGTGSTATAGSDFVLPTASVLVPAGQTLATMRVHIVDDTMFETTETVAVELGESSEYYLGTTSTHTLSIQDNETQPTLTLNRTSLVVEESTQKTGTTLQLSRPSSAPTTIGLTVGGSALAGSDFQNDIPTTVTIPAGATTVFVPITLQQDASVEPNESVVLVFAEGTDLWAAGTTAANRTFTLTITDDDTPIVGVTVGTAALGESHGTFALTATLSKPSSGILRVPVTATGTANRGGSNPDYFLPSNAEFVFNNSDTATLAVTIVNDNIVEPREQFTIQLLSGDGYKLGSVSRSNFHIGDDDKARISFDVAQFDRFEGTGSFTITARLDRPLPDAISVPISISGGNTVGYASSNDYAFSSAPFQFPAGALVASRTLSITEDSINEPTELAVIAFAASNFSSSSVVAAGTNTSTRIRILDNDPILSVGASNSSVVEGTNAVYTFRLSAATNVPLVIPFTLSGTSRANINHVSPSGSSVTIPTGQISVSIAIATINNSIASTTAPTLTLSIGSLTTAITSSSAKSATIAINDNDIAIVDFPAGDKKAIARVSEARTGNLLNGLRNRTISVPVNLSKPGDRAIDVTLSFSGKAVRNTDYRVLGLTNDKLRIPAGSTSATFTVEIIHDSNFEGDEAFTATIQSVSAPAKLPAGTKPARSFLIIDDDKKAVTQTNLALNSSSVPKTISHTPIAPASTGTLAISTSPVILDLGSFGNPTSLVINGGIAEIRPGQIALAITNGPIEGAIAYFDANFNGVLDADEPFSSTAIDGSFAVFLDEFDTNENGVIDLEEGRFVQEGGVDISTGLVRRIAMSAPIGLLNITPITTLVESLIRTQSLSISDAIDFATNALGVKDYNITSGNSLYQTIANDPIAARAYRAHVELHSAVLAISQYLAGISGRQLNTIGQDIYDEVADLVSTPDSLLDLTSDATVESLLGATVIKHAIAGVNDEQISSIAGRIAAAIQEMNSLNLESFTNGSAFVLALDKAKMVLQGEFSDALFDLGAGTRSLASLTADYSGPALVSKIAAVNATVTIPPAIGINSLSIIEGNGGTSVMRFSVDVIGDHNYPISVQYMTVDGSALAGQDYTATTGTLSWPANDNTTRYVDVVIHGDLLFESDESLNLLLTNASQAVIRVDEGTGFILNDDATSFATNSSGTSNDLLYLQSRSNASLVSNGVEVFNGDFAEPLSSIINGVADKADLLALDFSENTYRGDTVAFHAGNSSGVVDGFSALAGTFQTIEVSVIGLDSILVGLVPEEIANRTQVTTTGVEEVNLLVSDTTLLTIDLPSWVTSAILEDANPSESGRMRMVSPSGQFAPIEFRNPGTLVVRRASSATQLTTNSLDADFTAEQIRIETNNSAPTTIALSSNSVAESLSVGSVVGTFSTTDRDAGNTFTYQLVAGAGDTDNASFLVEGNQLKIGIRSDFETKSTYSVRIRSIDQGCLFVETAFTVTVLDVPEMVGTPIVGDGTVQRSMVNKVQLAFDSNIDIAEGAFTLVRRGAGGGAVTLNSPTLEQVGNQTIVTLTFAGSFTRNSIGALLDGYYQLTIDGSKITRSGHQLDVNSDGILGDVYLFGDDETDAFFALYGDSNGNRVVDAVDSLRFRNTLNKPVTNLEGALFDYNFNNFIDAVDSLRFRNNLNKPLQF
jgi:hypothetical protein